MRLLLGLIALLASLGCRNVDPPRKPYPHPVPRTVIASTAAPSFPPSDVITQTAPSAPAEAPGVVSTTIQGIRFDGVSFDSRNHQLIVLDQADGPGSNFADAAAAARSVGGIAAINGGYFTPEGAPLGQVIASGKTRGAWNSSSTLGSGVWRSSSSEASITRRESLGAAGARKSQQLIQAGPMLVEKSRQVSGLEATKSAVRTFIASDGGTRWWIGRSSASTLADLSKALVTGGPAGWTVRHALNLDGGRSADFWASSRLPGGPLTRRAAWNRPVRNFLVLVPLERQSDISASIR